MRRENCFQPEPGSGGRHRPAQPGAAGFSLIEMLTTVSVLAILLAIVAPGFASLLSANTLSAAQSELTASIMLARGEALRRGSQVGVAALAPTAGAEFSGGWVIYQDANSNGQFDAGETIIRQQAAMPANVRLATASGTTGIAFSSRGFLTPATLVNITACRASSGSPKGYRIRLEPVGLADVLEIATCT